MATIIHWIDRRRSAVLLMLLALVFGSGTAAAQQPHVNWSSDIEGSLQQAAADGRPVLMEFTAKWCTHCVRMEKTTFVDPDVAAAVNQNFVAIRVDADQNRSIVKELGIKGLPAMLVVAPDLQIIDRITGYQTPESLLERLDAALADTTVAVTPSASEISRPAAMESQQPAAPQPDFSNAPQFADANPAPVQTAAKPKSDTTGRVSLGDTAPAPAPAPASPRPPAVTQAPIVAEAPAADTSWADAPWANRPANESPAAKTTPTLPPLDSAANTTWTESAPAPSNVAWATETGRAASSPSAAVAAPAPTSHAAFDGNCPVAAIEERRIVQGKEAHRVICRGREVRFSSAEAQAKFESEPTKYWPMFDGLCPLTLAEQGTTEEGDLRFAVLFRKRIWLLRDQDAVEAFVDRPGETIQTALFHYQSLTATDPNTAR